MTNNTEKKNNNSKIIAILAILLIAVLSFGIWAWSKYTNSYSGKSASTVAKWNFTTDPTKIANIDLAKAVDGVVVWNDVNNVATDRIAPGTSGHFSIGLDATSSEVAVRYDIELTDMTGKPTNLHFYSDAECTKQLKDDAKLAGYIAQGDVGREQTVTIYWKWAYETPATENKTQAENDKTDTDEGKVATEKGVKFNISIVGTQVNPGAGQVTTGLIDLQ